MGREQHFDIDDEYLNFNFQNPLFRNLRPCKKIAPRNGKIVEIGRHKYSYSFPRIVKPDFKVLSDWFTLEEVQDGQELAPGKFHSCTRALSDNETINGYFVTTRRHSPYPEVVLISPGDFD